MANNPNTRNGFASAMLVGYIAHIFEPAETSDGTAKLDFKVLVNNGGSEPLSYMCHLYGEKAVAAYAAILEVGKQVSITANISNVTVNVDDQENVYITTHVSVQNILLCGSSGSREERQADTSKLKAALAKRSQPAPVRDDEDDEEPVKPSKKSSKRRAVQEDGDDE